MTNYIYVNTGTGGVYRKGQLGPIGQGSEGVDIIIEVRDLNKAPVDLTGYTTITATMEKRDTGAVTAVDGTLALNTTGADGLIKWTVSANDTGTDGTFIPVFDLTNGTDTYISLPCELVVTDNPTVTASANNLLVGILQAVKDWLTAEKAAIEAAVDGNLLQGDGDNSEDSGIAAADVALTAAVLPKDAGLLAKTEAYELAAGDEGKVIRCSGTFTVTLPDGLDTGFQAMISNISTGTITLAADTTLQGIGTQLTSQWSACYVLHVGSNVWEVYGGAE